MTSDMLVCAILISIFLFVLFDKMKDVVVFCLAIVLIMVIVKVEYIFKKIELPNINFTMGE